MKRILLIFGLLASMASLAPAEEGKIFVNGRGSAFVRPDSVSIEAGATTEGDTAAACNTKNRAIMDAVLANIKKFGLEDKDIKTITFSLNPKYDYDRNTGKNRITGYILTHVFRLQHKDIRKAGEIVDAVVSAGATNVNNIVFKVSDDLKYKSQARREAVKDARRKAEELADSAGVKLVKILSLQETEHPAVYPRFAAKAAMMAQDSAPTPVMEGESEISTSVSVTFEIK